MLPCVGIRYRAPLHLWPVTLRSGRFCPDSCNSPVAARKPRRARREAACYAREPDVEHTCRELRLNKVVTLTRVNAQYTLPDRLAVITVLPHSIKDSIGVYPNDSLTLVKELRAAGLDAAYMHDNTEREWRVQLGDVPTELLIAIVGAVVGGGVLEGLKILLAGRLRGHKLVATIVRVKEAPSGERDAAWYHFEGDGSDVAKVLDRSHDKRCR